MLSSSPINGEQAQELVNLVKKPKHSIKFGLIENALDVLPSNKVARIENVDNMLRYGFDYQMIDLNVYQNNHVELFQMLEKMDVIWFGDGNVFYLNWLLQSTRAGDILKYLNSRGVVFGGDGAGATVAGPTLKHFETISDQNLVPEIGLDGMGIINYVTIPHFDSQQNHRTLGELNKRLIREGFQTLTLNDGQAFIIDGNDERYI
jgi:peptidase E